MRAPPLLSARVTHRIGNWCEESVLREEQLKDFVSKLTAGTLRTQRAELKKLMALQEVLLPGKFEFGKNVMIKNVGTNGYLSVELPDKFPEGISENDIFNLTTADGVTKPGDTRVIPVARSTMKLIPSEEYAIVGLSDLVTPRYGEKVYITVSDALVEKPMFLCSDHKSFIQVSRRLNNQPAYLSFHRDARAVWQIVFPDPEMRLEMEGQLIKPGAPVILTHSFTGADLGSELGTKTMIRNDFGVEWDVDLTSRNRLSKWSRWTFEIGQK